MSLADIPRNNVPKAIAFITAELDRNGRVAPDDMHVLYMLQDDDEQLINAVNKLNEERRAAGKSTVSA